MRCWRRRAAEQIGAQPTEGAKSAGAAAGTGAEEGAEEEKGEEEGEEEDEEEEDEEEEDEEEEDEELARQRWERWASGVGSWTSGGVASEEGKDEGGLPPKLLQPPPDWASAEWCPLAGLEEEEEEAAAAAEEAAAAAEEWKAAEAEGAAAGGELADGVGESPCPPACDALGPKVGMLRAAGHLLKEVLLTDMLCTILFSRGAGPGGGRRVISAVSVRRCQRCGT